jgi:hypothetical protein
MERLEFQVEAPGTRRGVPLYRDDGTELDAHFYVDWDDIRNSVVFESRGGKKGTPHAKNVDYAEGLRLVLERLGRRRFVMQGVLLDTRETAHLGWERRWIKFDGVGWESDPERTHWVALADADPEDVRLRIMRAQGSNPTRRIRLLIRLLDEMLSESQFDTHELQSFLQRGGAVLEAAVEDVVDLASEPLIETRTEGGVRVVATKRYERDPNLRKQALQLHGTVCRVCDFDFEKAYGDIGRGYIQIHHVIPVSAGEREVNPSTDLVPLCANCHVMIHAKPGLTLSVEGLRSRIRAK